MNFEEMSDGELIELLRKNAEYKNKIFEILYIRYNKQLINYVRKRIHSIEDQKDIVQDVWTALFISINRNHSGFIFPQYLYGIALKKISDINKIHNKINCINLEDNNTVDFIYYIEDEYDKTNLIEYIKIATKLLNKECKEVFELKWINGLSIDEISKIKGLSTDCVKQRSSRAIKQIKELIPMNN